jgi:hypothetical protein
MEVERYDCSFWYTETLFAENIRMSISRLVDTSKNRVVPGFWIPRSTLTQVWSAMLQLSGSEASSELAHEMTPFGLALTVEANELRTRMPTTTTYAQRIERPFALAL